MSIMNYYLNFFDIVLAAACLALLLVSVFLLLRLMKRRKQCAELQKELELQKSRVLARKEKIRELREKMHGLLTRLAEDERKLLNSYTQEEISVFFPEILNALRQLLNATEVGRLPQSKQADVMSAAIRLSHLLQTAFRIEKDPLLSAEESAGQEGEPSDRSALPRRVLIVDDNEESRRFSAEIVEASGFLVDLAANGEDAVEKVRLSREGYYDLILMDIIMYGKSGYETCRDIRNLMRADCERIPVIALSANSFSEDQVQLVNAGMNDRISKPISRESFLGIADKWLRRQSVRADTSEDAAVWSTVLTADGRAATSF